MDFNDQLKDKVSSLKVIYVDLYTSLIEEDEDIIYEEDGIHFTSEGYQHVWKVLNSFIDTKE